MIWLLIIILVFGFAIASRGFRKLLLILGGIILLGVGLISAWLASENRAAQKERAAAKLRIPRANIEFVDLRLGLSESSQLTGRVRNKDPKYTLTGVELLLRVQECTTPTQCETVGEANQSIYLDVPSGQARAIDTYVYFSRLGSPRATRTWTYDLVSISGRE